MNDTHLNEDLSAKHLAVFNVELPQNQELKIKPSLIMKVLLTEFKSLHVLGEWQHQETLLKQKIIYTQVKSNYDFMNDSYVVCSVMQSNEKQIYTERT